ncbi:MULTISPECIES: PEP-CTERM sorting domain-containing protein [unclassified Coleofasciculus]|uniref:PEP-CTERM sorting domain-containing protein n=1 Tax=unclassified Coleofasciculus TaxID=2692782 RepID=UPI00187FFA33|nr:MULTISPECIES: PEP-CTERM sorting domain-containing protein [unclassified Coleofasciculus]MBE9124862.1 PEP-CTERM sorting domain-containing protein [Coleofasciculus sp. LEGE 07081]MBE9147894.1 PEP-CTERM sorting domain-containing protein [Coleofasciculus sp. LEGE 07092]
MFKGFYQSATIALATLLLTPTTTLAAAITFADAGADAASIQDTVDDFRAAVGEPNNGNAVGPIKGGRRQIDWDGRPGAAAPFDMPADFFNAIVPRGTVYDTPGSGFQISGADGDPNNIADDENFGNINPTYAGIFKTFSAEKLFTTIDSNILDVNFFVPGTDRRAAVSGFGAVFTDVDLPDTTTIEYYDLKDNLLFSDSVLTADNGLSFLGVLFDEGEQIGRVRITNGNAALSADNFDGNGVDVVAMDDFIFSEPEAVPEPSSLLGLLLAGILPLMGWRRRQGRHDA